MYVPESRMLLTPRQAALTLSVCEKTLWTMTVPRGPIPCVRFGRAVRYATADLRAFVDSQKQSS